MATLPDINPTDQVLKESNSIDAEVPRKVSLEDIYNYFPRVTAIPTWTPKRFIESMAYDTTGKILYIYNFVTAAWEISRVSLTANVTGILPVANGGTGVATLGDAGVLIGNGTGVVQVTGAGTAEQVLTSNGAGVDPTFQANMVAKVGNANREFDAASGDQVIAHGLGKTPKLVRLSAGIYIAATSSTGLSFGSYDGTTTTCIAFQGTTTQTNTSSTTNVLELYHTTTTNFQKATIAVDATNITLSWTLGGSQAGTMRIMWEAIS